jgi:hypothetical protein
MPGWSPARNCENERNGLTRGMWLVRTVVERLRNAARLDGMMCSPHAVNRSVVQSNAAPLLRHLTVNHLGRGRAAEAAGSLVALPRPAVLGTCNPPASGASGATGRL